MKKWWIIAGVVLVGAALSVPAWIILSQIIQEEAKKRISKQHGSGNHSECEESPHPSLGKFRWRNGMGVRVDSSEVRPTYIRNDDYVVVNGYGRDVLGVEPGSPAERLGIRQGDTIVEIHNSSLTVQQSMSEDGLGFFWQISKSNLGDSIWVGWIIRERKEDEKKGGLFHGSAPYWREGTFTLE